MPDQATLDNTIGAAFLGVSATGPLCGITIVQTQLYYRNFSKDRIVQRISVAILLTLAIFHLLFSLHTAYFYLITNFGNPKGLDYISWGFKMQLLISAFTVILVQGLYVLRIWKLGKHISRFWPALVVLIVVCTWTFGFYVVMKSCGRQYFTDFGSMRQVIYATFALLSCVDVIITTAFCYFLNWRRSSFIATNNKIFTVIRYMLIAGFITSVCSLSTLIAYAAMPHNMIFIGINLLSPHLYINSYIAMLNARKYMNEQDPLFVDVPTRVLGRRTGLTILTDDGNLRNSIVDEKMSPGGGPLSATRYTPNFTNEYEMQRVDVIQTMPYQDNQPIPTPPNGANVAKCKKAMHRIHRIDERQSRTFPLWVSRRVPIWQEQGGSVQPADNFATGSSNRL